MPRHRLLLLVIGLGFLLSSPVLRAHHAEAAEYDATKPVKVSGMLTKVEWQNPHVWFYVEVKEGREADDLGLFHGTARSADAPRGDQGGAQDRLGDKHRRRACP